MWTVGTQNFVFAVEQHFFLYLLYYVIQNIVDLIVLNY